MAYKLRNSSRYIIDCLRLGIHVRVHPVFCTGKLLLKEHAQKHARR